MGGRPPRRRRSCSLLRCYVVNLLRVVVSLLSIQEYYYYSTRLVCIASTLELYAYSTSSISMHTRVLLEYAYFVRRRLVPAYERSATQRTSDGQNHKELGSYTTTTTS